MSTPRRDAQAGDDPAQAILHTPLCELLGCRYPLILAGMGGVARSALVAAVTQAGGFGFLGMVREPLALIRDEVARVRRRTGRPFGVNLIPAATPPALLAAQVELCIELGVPVVGLFWDVLPEVVGRLRDAGILVVYQVGSALEARLAQRAGAGVLIAQGIEAGGHVRARQPLAQVLAEVRVVARVPVAAAGGIADGAGVARVLAQGAQAAVLGTALLATEESCAHDYHKQRLLEAQGSDTVLTEAFRINWPPHAPVRVLPNSVTRGEHGEPSAARRTVIGEEQGRPIYLFSTDSPLQSMTGDFEAMALYAGTGVGSIRTLEPAAHRIARLVAEAAGRLRPRAPDAPEPIEFASPVCYAAEFERQQEARDAHLRTLLARLDELLEAERAGARVALRMAAQAQDAVLKRAIELVHHDEAKWCAMLTRHIRRLQGTPSARTGAFYDKAMAIGDLHERLAFLNRGQGWVVRKLRELLTVVEDAALRDDLIGMLVAHEANIDTVDALLPPA
ncbi:nitronate monooxygenase [Plasticicumulans lactativorans]|uniref:Nitronate monooxygenase n=1 Tax=Plasticicumulans lactativorans TaxID=1133106 RepID=A0A4R2LDH6_9GAMM|nr:nitronate monooxygenase [Plasticicumulans lactativorans]TCO83672.1 nitronate monooxygenase [Plasticicumulans lactativorans]